MYTPQCVLHTRIAILWQTWIPILELYFKKKYLRSECSRLDISWRYGGLFFKASLDKKAVSLLQLFLIFLNTFSVICENLRLGESFSKYQQTMFFSKKILEIVKPPTAKAARFIEPFQIE
jgi:hypothetical protein